jgi:hypothetical protein
MIRRLSSAAVLSTVLFLCASAYANSGELLGFGGLGNLQPVGNFYNGGGLATTPNYGVIFSTNFVGLISAEVGGSGNYVPTINAPGQSIGIAAAIFITGPMGSMATGMMNVTQGFASGLNFYFTAGFTGGQAETVTIWSGVNGTGTVLATINLGNNNGGCTQPAYCTWSDVGMTFSGTAHSVTFSGPADELGIAEITVGSSTTAIPEPSSLFLVGSGIAAIGLSRLRRFFGV